MVVCAALRMYENFEEIYFQTRMDTDSTYSHYTGTNVLWQAVTQQFSQLEDFYQEEGIDHWSISYGGSLIYFSNLNLNWGEYLEFDYHECIDYLMRKIINYGRLHPCYETALAYTSHCHEE